jgi:hypothetical protein
MKLYPNRSEDETAVASSPDGIGDVNNNIGRSKTTSYTVGSRTDSRVHFL